MTMRLFLCIYLWSGVSLPSLAWINPSLEQRRSVPYHASTSNIVLEPSTDQDKFDSFKIGNARVHRYSREEDPESEVEYVMWYHGRGMDMDGKLPPLSTGRIGRAVSRNGLHWVKDEEGSASEDVPGVSLGLNKDSWWGFDTAHVGLGNVLLPMSTPAVMSDAGVYLMYFMGGSFEETLVGDYVSKEVPDSIQGAKIAGMRMKIGVAVSQDGISFGRVEGDDPSGACMSPYDKDDPNQQLEKVPSHVEEELYCAWPDVAVNTAGPEDRNFLMFYSTMTKVEKQKCIAYATSADGFRWYKQGVCLRPDATGLDAGGCARCCVIQDAVFDADKAAWQQRSSWTMFYEGVSPDDGKHRILSAASKDGRKWTKTGLALDVGGAEDDWDGSGVGAPHVLRMDDGTLRMYYTGQGADGSTAVGVAKSKSNDGVNSWHREQATISFAIE